MGVSKNAGTPKSSILIGFSIINHPFWGTPTFLETPICSSPKTGDPANWDENLHEDLASLVKSNLTNACHSIFFRWLQDSKDQPLATLQTNCKIQKIIIERVRTYIYIYAVLHKEFLHTSNFLGEIFFRLFFFSALVIFWGRIQSVVMATPRERNHLQI